MYFKITNIYFLEYKKLKIKKIIMLDETFIDDIINKNNKNITEELFKIIEMTIKLFDIIYERHQSVFKKDNLDLLYILKNDVKKVIYIEFVYKNKSPKIIIYETFRDQKTNLIIKNVYDFEEYSLVSVYIYYDNKENRNVFSILDFLNIIKDIKSMISLKIFLNIRNIDINHLYQDYLCPPLEMFYILYFLKNKKEKIVKDNYKIKINF